MKTNVFSEELLPACFVNSRTDLHSGSVFILSINDAMFIIAAIIRKGRRFVSMHRKRWSLLHPSRAVSLHLITCSTCDSHGKVALEQLPGVCQGRAAAVHFWSCCSDLPAAVTCHMSGAEVTSEDHFCALKSPRCFSNLHQLPVFIISSL